jgi:hypothetical protein
VLWNSAVKDIAGRAAHADAVVAGWMGKAEGRLARIALNFEYFNWAAKQDCPEPKDISGESMAKAIKYHDYAELMFAHTEEARKRERYSTERDADGVADYIMKKRSGVLNERELMRSSGYSHFNGDDKRLQDALEYLEYNGWLKRAGHEGFKRPRKDWVVNPEITAIWKDAA